MDVGMNGMVYLSEKALVGRLIYRNMSIATYRKWVTINWAGKLGYLPRLFTLAKVWLGVIFRSIEEAIIVLGGTWMWGTKPLKMKHWTPFLMR